MNNKQLRIKRKWDKSGIQISRQLRDFIHGYIMSDGFVTKGGILYVDQSKKQEKFVLWLEFQLKSIQSPSGINQQIRIHPKTKKQTRSLRFWTKAVLHGFHHMWYTPYTDMNGKTRYKKKLPHSFNCIFTAQTISVWFAGDGTKILGSIGAKFEVSCFTVEERLNLQKLFVKKFGIKTVIIMSGQSNKNNTQWALKIPAKQYDKFRDLVTEIDLIPTLFPYKLHKKH